MSSRAHEFVLDAIRDDAVSVVIERGDRLVFDLRALHGAAKVEVQSGVRVLASREAGEGERLELSFDAIAKLGDRAAIAVFVTAPEVAHGRSSGDIKMAQRYLELRVRVHDPRPVDWALRSGAALWGAVLCSEWARIAGASSAARNALAFGCGALPLLWFAWWMRTIARRAPVARWGRAASVALAVIASAPLFIGARVVWMEDDGSWRTQSRWALSVEGSALSAIDERAYRLPRARWSQRWMLTRKAPGERERFAEVSAAWAAAWRGARCDERGCVERVREGAMRSVDGRWSIATTRREEDFSQHARDPQPVEVRTSFVCERPLTIEWAPSASMRASLHRSQSITSPAVFSDAITTAQFDDDRSPLCDGRLVRAWRLAPRLGRVGASLEAACERHVVSCHADWGRAEARWYSLEMQPIGDNPVFDMQSLEAPSGPMQVAVRADDEARTVQGFIDCPDTVDEQREMRVLTRVFGLEATRGLVIMPVEHSKAQIGTWTAADEREAHRFATVCTVIRGEALPRADRAFGMIHRALAITAPIDVAVGTLASGAPVRAGQLAPRRIGPLFAGLDLRLR